jgi:hypothetical protein
MLKKVGKFSVPFLLSRLLIDSESSPCAGEPCGLEGVCIPMPDDKYVCLCQNRVIAAKSCNEGKKIGHFSDKIFYENFDSSKGSMYTT